MQNSKVSAIDGINGRDNCIQAAWRPRRRRKKFHASVEILLPAAPALSDVVPIRLWNGKPAKDRVVGHRTVQKLVAHGLDIFAATFDVVFDLSQGETVVNAFIPIAHAARFIEFKAVVERRPL